MRERFVFVVVVLVFFVVVSSLVVVYERDLRACERVVDRSVERACEYCMGGLYQDDDGGVEYIPLGSGDGFVW